MSTSGKLDIPEIKELVLACTYKPGWRIIFDNGEMTLTEFGTRVWNRPWFQIMVDETAEASTESSGPNKGVRSAWKAGKVYLSRYMCRQEIVSAVFAAFLRAEEHESREWFRYKGASIFNPHLDPDVLVEIARKKSSFNVRANAMTMVET